MWPIALGTIFANMMGQQDTNETNQNIANTNNYANYRLWKEQQRASDRRYASQVEQMWKLYNQQVEDSDRQWKERFDMQNEYEAWYNSPEHQRQLLEEAGYNPNIYGGDATASVNGGSSSVNPSVSQPQWQMADRPTMQGYQYQSPLSAGLDNAVNNMLKLAQSYDVMNNTDANRENTEARTAGLGLDFELKNTFGRNLLKWQVKDAEENSRWLPHMNASAWNLMEDQRELLKANKNLVNQSSQTQSILNKWLPYEKQLQFMTDTEKLVLLKKQGKLTDAQVESIVATRLLTMANLEGKQIENHIARQTAKSTIDAINFRNSLDNLQENFKANLDFIKSQAGVNWSKKALTDKETGWYDEQQWWKMYTDQMELIFKGGDTSARIVDGILPF